MSNRLRMYPLLVLAAALASAQPHSDLDTSASELRPMIERYTADRGNLGRFYNIDASTNRRIRLKQFYRQWMDRLQAVNFDRLSQEGKVDYVLLRNHLDHETQRLDIEAKAQAETDSYIPFGETIVTLEESRRKLLPLNPKETAATMSRLAKQVAETQKAIEAQARTNNSAEATHARRVIANRAAVSVTALRTTLRNWHGYFNGYDPMFTWWVAEPYKHADAALQSYATYLREKLAGLRAANPESEAPVAPGRGFGGGTRPGGAVNAAASARPGQSDDIIGDPIGREALLTELAFEMVAYTPDELVSIANKEFAWCENEMRKASRELGFGDDWKKALEHVKGLHVDPGKQTELIRDLAREAEKFLDDHDLVTVPPLARETWRMEMMSPERQLVNPFFLGGEVISVSYPVAAMTNEQKLTTMRGNNIHFSRATVFHELIPGHHLQGFMAARFRPYRNLFSTPFLTEGWSLYWELLLWDMKFQKSAADRVGALFWRMHRCARIIFSLSFHLKQMTPEQCIDFLVERVGHERENATGEVRRSFGGAYSPLYQAAYLLGGLQLYSLRKELVESQKMTNRQFHDAILREGRVPIEMIRASLAKQSLTRDFKTSWKFYGVR
jgi:uncharacterized protein (DUF885 family)